MNGVPSASELISRIMGGKTTRDRLAAVALLFRHHPRETAVGEFNWTLQALIQRADPADLEWFKAEYPEEAPAAIAQASADAATVQHQDFLYGMSMMGGMHPLGFPGIPPAPRRRPTPTPPPQETAASGGRGEGGLFLLIGIAVVVIVLGLLSCLFFAR